MAELRIILPDDVDKYLETVIKSGMFGNKAELARAAIVHFLNTIGPISKGYDTDNFFSPDGRIFQVEYARESMMRGATVIGMVCTDGVLLASEDAKSKLDKSSHLLVSPLKLHRISNKVLVGYAGLVADALIVIDNLRVKEFKNEEEVLAAIREIFWSHTTNKEVRPLGTGLLVATHFRRPRLFEADPSGAIMEFVAGAIGEGRDGALTVLQKGYKKMSTKEAGKVIAKVLGDKKEYSVEILRGD
jgi:20S proteasome alpha/beta subunit